MKMHYFSVLGLGAAVAVVLAPVASSAKPASFDGTWNVRLVTESGTCDSSYNQTIAVENGQVRPVSSGAESTSISGGVGLDGNVALTIRRSLARANASGRLRGRSGSGDWQLAMLGCSGRWTARRA